MSRGGGHPDGISALMNEDPETSLALSTTWRRREDGCPSTRKEALTRCQIHGHLGFGFPAWETDGFCRWPTQPVVFCYGSHNGWGPFSFSFCFAWISYIMKIPIFCGHMSVSAFFYIFRVDNTSSANNGFGPSFQLLCLFPVSPAGQAFNTKQTWMSPLTLKGPSLISACLVATFAVGFQKMMFTWLWKRHSLTSFLMCFMMNKSRISPNVFFPASSENHMLFLFDL